MSRVLVEVCVEEVATAVLAEQLGADRVEICADLAEGGLTPSLPTLVELLRRVSRIGIQVLIRPRPGGFAFDEVEAAVMLADIAAIRALPTPLDVRLGFVVGALRPDGEIDAELTERLRDAAGPSPVTFHKAFDATPKPLSSLEVLADLGISRVLTSGGAETAAAGTKVLADLVAASAGRVSVLAGGAIRTAGVHRLVERTGVTEIHFAARGGLTAGGELISGVLAALAQGATA